MKKKDKWCSLLQQDREYCYLCDKDGIYNNYFLQKHHIFHGPNKNNSEREGLYVALCVAHHEYGPQAVHTNRQVELDLKREAQQIFEETHSHEEFMAIFGKNYL